MSAERKKAKKSASDAVDRFILRIGHFLSWANGLLIVVIVLQVILRYGFGHGLVILEELEWHLYSLAFMFGLSYAIVTDAHVRVDLLYNKLVKRTRAWIEICGTLILLLPFIVVVIIYGLEFFYLSWIHNERSLAPMGLPWRWIIKSVIPLSFGMFGLAAVSRVIRAISIVRRKEHADS